MHSMYIPMLNLFVAAVNVVKTAQVPKNKANSDIFKHKNLTKTKGDYFKYPQSFKNGQKIQSPVIQDYDNKSIDIIETQGINDSKKYTFSTLFEEETAKQEPISSGSSILAIVSNSHENPITTPRSLIESIPRPTSENNFKNQTYIPTFDTENNYGRHNMHNSSNTCAISTINTAVTIEPLSTESSLHNPIQAKAVDLNIGVSSIKTTCYTTSDMFIDQYIDMINDPSIYNMKYDCFSGEGSSEQLAFPLFTMNRYSEKDTISYSTKATDDTIERKNKSKKIKAINEEIYIPHTSSTNLLHPGPVRRNRANKSDDYSQELYIPNICPIKHNKAAQNRTCVYKVADKTDTTTKKTTVNTNKGTLSGISHRKRKCKSISYHTSDDTTSITNNQSLAEPQSKKFKKKEKHIISSEPLNRRPKSEAFKYDPDNNWLCNFFLNGQNIQHEFHPPQHTSLLLENIKGTLQEIPYTPYVFNKYNRQRDTYKLQFYINITNFNKLEIETSANIQSIVFVTVSDEYSIHQNVHITLYALRNSDNTKHKVFIRKFPVLDLNKLLSNLLSAKFRIYNFSKVGLNHIINFKSPPCETEVVLLSVKQYINEFEKIKSLLRIKSPDDSQKIPQTLEGLKYSNIKGPSRRLALFTAVNIIKEDCVQFIESIEDMKRILADTSIKDNYVKTYQIKTILNRIISRLSQIRFFFKTENNFGKAYLYETRAISFDIFLHTEVKEVLKYWNQHISESNELMEIELN